MNIILSYYVLFFFNDTATTEIYTLSLHDALPISSRRGRSRASAARPPRASCPADPIAHAGAGSGGTPRRAAGGGAPPNGRPRPRDPARGSHAQSGPEKCAGSPGRGRSRVARSRGG